MSMKILTEATKWNGVKEQLLEGLSGARKRNLEIVLENQRKFLVENATAGSTSASMVATLPKLIMPLVRRVQPGVIHNEIMGVQPMTGPIGQVSTLRVQYAQTVPADGSGVQAGEEALGPHVLARYYSGNEDVNDPFAAPTSVLEGTMGRRVNVRIMKEMVEAKSHRLSAIWTVESMQDSQSQYGVDIEAELMAALAQEITVEIDQIMLGRLRRLAGPPAVTFDQNNVSGVATSVVDEHAALAVLINQQANKIGQLTRRRPANWAVVSADALTILQSARASAFAQTTKGDFEGPTNVQYVGTLNTNMRVFSDTYAGDNEAVLIGFKGDNETDAPAFVCPYIPLMNSGTVMNPETGEYTTTFLQRYGYVELKSTQNSLGNAADYVSRIGISNQRFA